MLDKIDEINLLNDLTESNYYDYFVKMDLPDEEIAKRIETAEELENEFMVILALALLLYRQGDFDRQRIQRRFRESYLKIGGKRIASDSWYLNQRATEFSEDVSRATESHLDSEYYTSLDRAMSMSQTESNVINNYAWFRDMAEQGYTRKRWMTMRDKRVRDSHRGMEGKTIGLYEYFDVNGYQLLFPCDTSLSPPASVIAGCRCSLKFLR